MPSESLVDLATRLQAGVLTPAEHIEDVLARIEQAAPLNAFRTVHRERARAEARTALSGPLAGVAIAIKDNFDEAGVVSAAGSKAYLDRVPARDAAAVARLRRAGAIVVGRTNMHELADGVTSENPHFGPVRHPLRPDHHPGGSSGGSAVAVAVGAVPAALGTDTGGSIRIPASLTGIAGFKPTYGLVSTEGVVPLSTSLDCVGPLAQSAADLGLLLEVLTGASFPRSPKAGLRLRLGVLRGFGLAPDEGVRAVFESALERLEQAGFDLRAIDLPALAGAPSLLGAIYAPEAARAHEALLRERSADLGAAVRADLERGARLDPARTARARAEARQLTEALDRAMRGSDCLICPTTPHVARPFGSPDPHTYLAYTCPFNLTGQPALSLPMGLVQGLPIGLQLVGRRGADRALLEAGLSVEALFRCRS